jgi:two-component system, NtrC family, nitrogen regulation sensor histidine kinase NtrY
MPDLDLSTERRLPIGDRGGARHTSRSASRTGETRARLARAMNELGLRPRLILAGTALVSLPLSAVFALTFLGHSSAEAVLFTALCALPLAWLGLGVLGRRADARRAELERDLGQKLEVARAQAGLFEAARAVAEATPLALLLYSDTGRIVYANAGARELFFEGTSPVGKNFLELIGAAPEKLRRALLGTSDELFSLSIAGQDETYHLSRRVFDREQELHTLLIVRHLTREVSRREVEVLKKVIRVISHELNNSLAPIASLVNSARIIAKNPEHAEKLARVFDTIEDRAQHLSAFLDEYAKFARLPKPRLEEVSWARFVPRFAELYPEAVIKGPAEGSGYFDRAQIEQLLINLLKNAKESGSAPNAIELSIRGEADGSLSFEVNDRGKGLSAEALESAFLPFYSTKERGSGMGLALSREVAEAHGGRLSLRNREGGGSVAILWLPGRARPSTLTSSRAKLTLTRA